MFAYMTCVQPFDPEDRPGSAPHAADPGPDAAEQHAHGAVGARVWLTRIMITWGLVIVAMCFIHNVTMFYVLRFLLGVAEAGFFPGVLLYL